MLFSVWKKGAGDWSFSADTTLIDLENTTISTHTVVQDDIASFLHKGSDIWQVITTASNDPITLKIKTVDQALTGTALQLDNDLFLSLEANTKYKLEMAGFATAADFTGGAPGMKIGWDYPSGATMKALWGRWTKKIFLSLGFWENKKEKQ